MRSCQRMPDRGNSVPPPACAGFGSVRSRPEQNPRPAPVSTTTRQSLLAAMASSERVQLLDQLVVQRVELLGPVEREHGDVGTRVGQFQVRHAPHAIPRCATR